MTYTQRKLHIIVKNADEMINATKLLGGYLNLKKHVKLKIRYNKYRGDMKIRGKK